MGVVINPGKKPWYTSAMGITITGTTKTYKTYIDMLKDPYPGKLAWVEDASADETVNKGSALYSWKNHVGWTKLYETESMDIDTSSHGLSSFIGYVGSEEQLESIYTLEKLSEMFPGDLNGIFAIVGSTDTIWVWDSDTNKWKNTGNGGLNITASVKWDQILNKPEVYPSTVELVKDGDRTLASMLAELASNITINRNGIDVLGRNLQTLDNGLANVALSGKFSDLKGIPETFPPENHSHDERYALINHNHDSLYATVSEVDAAIAKQHFYEDYTAFEVFAHDVEIPKGMSAELGDVVTFAIPANMTHKMYIRSFIPKDEIDVIVDWGDGSKTILQELADTNISAGSEYRYHLVHTYSEPGKYIVKIFGKDYWAVLPNTTNVGTNPCNLMCRVFDHDLPIASHLYNLSSFCYGAIRLLKVNVSNSNFSENNIRNTAYLFTQCRNLLRAIGFYRYSDTIVAENNIFENCHALLETDYQLHTRGSKALAFHRCRVLGTPEADGTVKTTIESLLPPYFSSKKVNVDRLFNECGFLTGTIPAGLLWDNDCVTFENTASVFNLCSDVLRNQAPVSWDGTNRSIDAKMHIQDSTYYTSFEVCPNLVTIEPGEDPFIGTVTEAVPPATLHRMVIRTQDACMYNEGLSDVVVEWGDGTYSAVANGDHKLSTVKDDTASLSAGEVNYTFEHDYAAALSDKEPIKKFTIKIYGKRYYAISHLVKPANTGVYQRNNLMCNVFCGTLRLAEHVGNITSMCEYAKRLTRVDVNNIKYRFIENASNTFRGCTNLISATGFKRNFTMTNCSGMFSGDYNLVTSDAQLPFGALRSSAGSTMYYNCPKLAVDIDKLIPEIWSGVGPFSLNQTFYNCDGLLSVNGDKLWNNPKITFVNTAQTFAECSPELRALIPVSWGGTGLDEELIIDRDKVLFESHVKKLLNVSDDEIVIEDNTFKETLFNEFCALLLNNETFKETLFNEFHEKLVDEQWGE